MASSLASLSSTAVSITEKFWLISEALVVLPAEKLLGIVTSPALTPELTKRPAIKTIPPNNIFIIVDTPKLIFIIAAAFLLLLFYY